MENRFEAPPFTTLASFDALARNVGSASLQPNSQSRDRSFAIERIGDKIHWHQNGQCLVFPHSIVAAIEVLSLQNAGQRFVALVLTFTAGAESLRYRMMTSHESEADWLKQSSTQIAHLLGRAASDLSKSCPS